jgi:hypothetical protein
VAFLRDTSRRLKVRADKLRKRLADGGIRRDDHRAVKPGGIVKCNGGESAVRVRIFIDPALLLLYRADPSTLSPGAI